MYVICVYDVESKRCNKYLKVLRKYLFHTQNSVFEGELTQNQLDRLIEDINKFRTKDDKISFYYVYKNKELQVKKLGQSQDDGFVF